jgi:hypothetical protein
MAVTTQYNFVMSIEPEGLESLEDFEILRFTYDPAGFHAGHVHDEYLDSLNGDRDSLHVLCQVIEAQKTLLFIKRTDLVTVKLLEMYLQKKPLQRVFLVATETTNGGKTTRWVACLDLKNVSIVGLKTRQKVTVLPNGEPYLIDLVSMRADEAFERDYDAQGNPARRPDEWDPYKYKPPE